MTRQYVRTASGTVHVRENGRTLEQDNLDQARLTVIPDLKSVRLDDLCERCFSPTSASAVLEAAEAADRDPEPYREPFEEGTPKDGGGGAS